MLLAAERCPQPDHRQGVQRAQLGQQQPLNLRLALAAHLRPQRLQIIDVNAVPSHTQ